MVTEYDNICALCGAPKEHTHHLVFGRGMRPLADSDHLTIGLCSKCHMAIHEDRTGVAQMMSKIIGQMEYEKTHTREEFRKRYGRSYL